MPVIRSEKGRKKGNKWPQLQFTDSRDIYLRGEKREHTEMEVTLTVSLTVLERRKPATQTSYIVTTATTTSHGTRSPLLSCYKLVKTETKRKGKCIRCVSRSGKMGNSD